MHVSHPLRSEKSNLDLPSVSARKHIRRLRNMTLAREILNINTVEYSSRHAASSRLISSRFSAFIYEYFSIFHIIAAVASPQRRNARAKYVEKRASSHCGVNI